MNAKRGGTIALTSCPSPPPRGPSLHMLRSRTAPPTRAVNKYTTSAAHALAVNHLRR